MKIWAPDRCENCEGRMYLDHIFEDLDDSDFWVDAKCIDCGNSITYYWKDFKYQQLSHVKGFEKVKLWVETEMIRNARRIQNLEGQ